MDVKLPEIRGRGTRLFSTVVGSHMWRMNHEKSDIDVATLYCMNPKGFLRDRTAKNYQTKSDDLDEAVYEVSNAIVQLKKMNVNYIWLVTSPIVVAEKSHWLQRLRQIVIENPSKQIYYSVRGLARNNIKDHIEKGDPRSDKYKKKLNTIGRTLKFGIHYLIYNKFVYEKVDIKSADELDELVLKLNRVYAESSLPVHPDPEPFDQYLQDVRSDSFRRL